MSTRKQREILRQRRVAFDRTVAENRKNADLSEAKAETTNTSAPKKKTNTTKKKTSQKG